MHNFQIVRLCIYLGNSYEVRYVGVYLVDNLIIGNNKKRKINKHISLLLIINYFHTTFLDIILHQHLLLKLK